MIEHFFFRESIFAPWPRWFTGSTVARGRAAHRWWALRGGYQRVVGHASSEVFRIRKKVNMFNK